MRIESSKVLRLDALFVLAAVLCNSTMVSRLCVACLFVTCIVLGNRERQTANPYHLFALTPFTLMCYFSVSDYYMLDLDNSTWVFCIINIFAFIIGLYVTKPYKKVKNCIGVKQSQNLRIHAVFLFAGSLMAVVIPPLAAVLALLSIPAIVCAIKSKDKLMIALVILYMVGIALSGQMSKTAVLLDLVTIIISYIKYYGLGKLSKLRIAAIAVASVAIMVFSFTFATKGEGMRDNEETLSYYGSRVDWNYSAALFLPYMYLETPWTNVEHVIKTQNDRTYGLWTIMPLLGYVGLDDKLNLEDKLEPYSSFNVFSFVTVQFKDYGYWLSILPSLLLGFFVKKIYSRYKISRSPFDVACYIAVAMATIMMFFSNHFFMESYPFTLLILMELYKRFVASIGGAVEVEPGYE